MKGGKQLGRGSGEQMGQYFIITAHVCEPKPNTTNLIDMIRLTNTRLPGHTHDIIGLERTMRLLARLTLTSMPWLCLWLKAIPERQVFTEIIIVSNIEGILRVPIGGDVSIITGMFTRTLRRANRVNLIG